VRHSKQRRGKSGMLLAVVACGVALGFFVVLSGCDLFPCNHPPLTNFEVSEKPRPRVEVVFTNTSTDPNGFNDLREFFWEFGDGLTADTMNASHVYRSADDYTVKLTVYDTAGNADTCQKDVHCISDVFAEPETEDEAVGKCWDWVKARLVIPERCWYKYDETLQAWVVCYPKFQAPDGHWYIVAENVLGIIPVRFVEDLSQPIVLEVSWKLKTSVGTLLYQYDYPLIYIRDPSQTTGVDAAWDLWEQGANGRRVVLSEGTYEVYLEIKETNTHDIFVWYFPFVVQWGC